MSFPTIHLTTDPTTITGRSVRFTVAGQSGPLTIAGHWVTLTHMDLGGHHQGMGGLMATTLPAVGNTYAFMPYGTVVIPD